MEKTLPQVLGVEQTVLAHLLMYPDNMALVIGHVQASDFYRNAHSLIFASMCRLYDTNKAIDPFTVGDDLEQHGHLIDVEDGVDYLIRLQGDTLWSTDLRADAALIARKAYQRRLIHAAASIAAIGYEGGEDATDMHQKAAHLLETLDTSKDGDDLESLTSIMETCGQEIEQAHRLRHSVIGVPTGFTDLDRMTGGLQKTDLIVLAARPSMGKSALAMGIAYNAARRGKRIAVFSLEMGKRQLGQRLISLVSRVPTERLRNGWIHDEEWDAIVAAQSALADLPIYIDDTSGSPVLSMKAKMRRKQREMGASFDLLVVDYLQLMEVPGEDARRKENRTTEVSEISRGLKGIAKEFDIPVLALGQLNRAVESRASKIPQLSDLRESGAIEQDADIVAFLYRDEYYNPGVDKDGKPNSERPGQADVIFAKSRNGPVGEVTLAFNGQLTRFDNLEVTPA